MKNNKGFTLVELLAVIVVLALIIGIAVPNAISLSNKSKKRMYISKIDMIIKAAELYGEDHPKSTAIGSCSGTTGIVTVDDLVKDGKVKKDNENKAGKPQVEDPYSGNDMSNLKLCIYRENNQIYAELVCNGKKWMDNGIELSTEYCPEPDNS